MVFSLCTALTVSPELQNLPAPAIPRSGTHPHPPSTSLKSSHHSGGERQEQVLKFSLSLWTLKQHVIIPLIRLTSNCISLAMSSWILWALSVSVVPSRLQRAMMASISARYLQKITEADRILTYFLYRRFIDADFPNFPQTTGRISLRKIWTLKLDQFGITEESSVLESASKSHLVSFSL